MILWPLEIWCKIYSKFTNKAEFEDGNFHNESFILYIWGRESGENLRKFGSRLTSEPRRKLTGSYKNNPTC